MSYDKRCGVIQDVRIELSLNAIASAEYDPAAHHKLRGRIWRGLEDKDRYAETHDTDQGVGFSFSNVFPWGHIQEGDQRHLRIASPRRAVLDDLVAHFEADRSFDVGQMRFEVEDITGHTPHVGEPGATGDLTTGTGVFCAFGPEQADAYGLDTSKMRAGDSTTELYWRPEHGLGPLQDTMRRSLQQTHDLYGDDYYDGPMEVDEPLFERVEPIKDEVTYVVRFQPTADVTRTVILSKWRLGYRVRDETHRYHLNLALDAGLGQRREHGFGFLNLRDQTPPRAEAG